MNILSRLLSVTAISFDGGRCVELKGKVGRDCLEGIADLLAEAGVKRGEIWIGGDGRIKFSREIDPTLHQQLRNILLR